MSNPRGRGDIKTAPRAKDGKFVKTDPRIRAWRLYFQRQRRNGVTHGGFTPQELAVYFAKCEREDPAFARAVNEHRRFIHATSIMLAQEALRALGFRSPETDPRFESRV
jgi:hypothetical protein